MGYRDDDDREKPSWREIDKMRDRSPHRRERRSEAVDSASRFMRSDSRKKQYMRQLERQFFGGKKGGPHEEARAALLSAAGTPGFRERARAYFADWADAGDWEALLALLDVTDPDLLEKAAQRLVELFPARSPAEQKIALSKLRITAMSAKDPDLVEVAREALARIEGG